MNKKAFWMKLPEEKIREAYEKTNTLCALCKELGYKSTLAKEKLMPMFEKYNLDPNKYNYSEGLNLVGKTYNFLKVIELDNEQTKAHHRKYWKCLCIGCNSNNIVSLSQSNLTTGAIKSCGCLRGKSQREDLTGQIFGFLQAVSFDEEKTKNSRAEGSKKTYCKCKCLACNRPDLVSVHTYHLKTNHTASCGCKGSKSVIEPKIAEILTKNNVKFKEQFAFPDLKGDSRSLRFDFAIFDKENNLICLIEYNGIQHYEPREYFGGEEGFKNSKSMI